MEQSDQDIAVQSFHKEDQDCENGAVTLKNEDPTVEENKARQGRASTQTRAANAAREAAQAATRRTAKQCHKRPLLKNANIARLRDGSESRGNSPSNIDTGIERVPTPQITRTCNVPRTTMARAQNGLSQNGFGIDAFGAVVWIWYLVFMNFVFYICVWIL